MRSEASVDIIMPTNRAGAFISEALESVVVQDHPDWRVILVDDGSAEPERLDRLASALPSAVVIHQPPSGVSAARNAAIRASDAEFVTFLDDDDRWPDGRLTSLIDALRDDPSALGAFGDGRYIDARSAVQGKWRTAAASQGEFLRGSTPIPRITALLVRRSALLEVGGFNERLAFSEDDELILRLLRHGRLVGTGAVVVDYRRHSDNATRADWRIRYSSARTAVEANIAAARSAGREDQVAMLQLNLRRLRSSTAANSTGRIVDALRAGQVGAAARDAVDSVLISASGFVRGVGSRVARKLRGARH